MGKALYRAENGLRQMEKPFFFPVGGKKRTVINFLSVEKIKNFISENLHMALYGYYWYYLYYSQNGLGNFLRLRQ